MGTLNKGDRMLTTARLISYSQPPEGELYVGNDVQELIAYCARVSNPANQQSHKTSEKLIRYLCKHAHWSPLEMASACIEIETTRDIAHQIVRHRSFSFQEFSQRYAEVTDTPVVPDLRMQDHSNRQNSIDSMDEYEKQQFQLQLQQHYEQSMWLYKQMLTAGVAKECAREVLPVSTKTTMYMHGNLRSWIHYIDLRTANGTQKEHMLIAQQCQQLVKQYFPAVASAVWS